MGIIFIFVEMSTIFLYRLHNTRGCYGLVVLPAGRNMSWKLSRQQGETHVPYAVLGLESFEKLKMGKSVEVYSSIS